MTLKHSTKINRVFYLHFGVGAPSMAGEGSITTAADIPGAGGPILMGDH